MCMPDGLSQCDRLEIQVYRYASVTGLESRVLCLLDVLRLPDYEVYLIL